jgi:hypothetical protein
LSDSNSNRALAVAVLWKDGKALVERIQFRFLAIAACSSVLRILTDREADSLAFFAPFEVIRTLGMPLWLAIYLDDVGPDAAVLSEEDNNAFLLGFGRIW